MDNMVNQLNFLHNYSIISANPDKDEYCIIETENSCGIEVAEEEFSLEKAENDYTTVTIVSSEHEEQHPQNIEIEYCTDSVNDIYCAQNSDEVFTIRNGERKYCIEISEEMYGPQSLKMKPNDKNQANQLADKNGELQKLSLIFSNGYHVCDVCNRAFRKKKVDPNDEQIVEDLQKSDDEVSQCNNIHQSTNGVDLLKTNASANKTYLNDLISDADDPNNQNSPGEDLDTFEVSYQTHTFENIQDKLYSCNQCSRHFIKEKSLNAHLQKHLVLGKDPLKCSVCKANFTHVSRLKEHFVTHSVPANNPSNPLDDVFFIPNRVEPRLTKIIKNLEARLMQSSDKECNKKLPSENIFMQKYSELKQNKIISMNQNIEQIPSQSEGKASTQSRDSNACTNLFDYGVSKRTRVFKHHNLKASLERERKVNKYSKEISGVNLSNRQNKISSTNNFKCRPVIKPEPAD
ncbi:zinc finger protein [Nephila pilipes]|uniref:Zinc finger protein n=1 Tax=Nephila pilipes TaxID=299642 RepID=A0A8X6NGT4_NEPPI|nr:zinc finger protein [Nephila pilipes]